MGLFLFVPSALTLILDPTTTTADLLCPGDDTSYHCAIISTSLDLELAWVVTFSGQVPVTVVYDSNSTDANNDTDIGSLVSVSTTITDVALGDHIESVVTLTALENRLRTDAVVECRYMDVLADREFLPAFNISGTHC